MRPIIEKMVFAPFYCTHQALSKNQIFIEKFEKFVEIQRFEETGTRQ
mgnify:CR=1 FL=1